MKNDEHNDEQNEWARQQKEQARRLADMVEAWERQPNHVIERYLNQR